jgi:flavin-dependent dehydrogenase
VLKGEIEDTQTGTAHKLCEEGNAPISEQACSQATYKGRLSTLIPAFQKKPGGKAPLKVRNDKIYFKTQRIVTTNKNYYIEKNYLLKLLIKDLLRKSQITIKNET